MNLSNKVIWITGASSGIGESLAHILAKENCKLVLSARREKELERVRKDIAITDENILILPIDLEQSKDASLWTKKVLDKFNRIDFLINNGGISQKGFGMDTQEEVERKIMEINYFGNVALTKAVIPTMQKQKSGKIVVISSIIGKFGLPNLTTYAASKHALYGYYESLRMELKPDNIAILLVAPGFIKTNVAINALKGDGNITNINSDAQEKGMSAPIFAKKLIRIMKSQRKHAYIGGKELLTIPFKTFFPNIFYQIMYKLTQEK